MDHTVESLCNLMARNRLHEPEAIRSLRQRWRGEARDQSDDSARFLKWLAAHGYLTDFQYGMLTRGFGDLLWLNDYKLLDRVGQGRMAGVYKAVHKLGQVVAIKVLPPSKAKHPNLLARFFRESRLACRLKHVNVVRAYQRGKTPGDLHYLVMEFLDGETLEEIVQRRGMLPPQEAAHVLYQSLLGLQHLDEVGLVHRDLKPANLMLVPAPLRSASDTTWKATVKVLDIGLGRALFDEGAASPEEFGELTNEGTLLGTPNYMAPEQARSAHSADIRADIYSLGCVLYELLTGKTPFPDSSYVRQMIRHATEQPRPVKELNPAVPDGFQEVLDNMLAKDPAQRYPTPAQAAKAVKALLDQKEETREAPEGPMESYLTWLEMNLSDEEPTAEADDQRPTQIVTFPPAEVFTRPTADHTSSAASPARPAAAVAPPPPVPASSPAPVLASTAKTPVPVAKPIAPPPALASTRPASTQPTPMPRASVPVAQPVAPPAVPVAEPTAPPAPTANANFAFISPTASRDGPVKKVLRRESRQAVQPRLFPPTRRDLLYAALGSSLLLALEVVIWLVVRLFFS
jgi:serine/threonine protein kinase